MNTSRSDRSVVVITRTRDRTELVPRAVRSVLSQSYERWHHVIVNDGGDTETLDDVIAPFRKAYAGRLSVIHNPISLGMEAASNVGLRELDSEYVTVHDDDDSWCPDFLSRAISVFEATSAPSVMGVVTRITQIFEKLGPEGVEEVRRQDYDPGLHAITLPQMLEVNQFLPIAFLYKRDALNKVGLYDETLPVLGDWDFNIRFLARYDIVVLPENLANYHVRIGSEGAYRNSVEKQGLHSAQRAMLINKYIREEIDSGQISLGQLIAIGDSLHRMNRDVSRIGRLLDKLKGLSFISWMRAKLGT